MRWIRFLAIALISFFTIAGASFGQNDLVCLFLGNNNAACHASLISHSRANATLAPISIDSNESNLIIAQNSGPPTSIPPTSVPPTSIPSNQSPDIPDINVPPSRTPNSPSDFDLFPTQDDRNSNISDRPSFEQAIRRADVNDAVRIFEEYQTNQFKNYLGLDYSIKTLNSTEISQTLSKLYLATGQKAALSYFVALKDELQLILILPSQSNQTSLLTKQLSPDRQKVDIAQQKIPLAEKVIISVSRSELVSIVNQFRKEILSKTKRGSNSYLDSAQKLYQLLIAPLEPQLIANQIDTLLISADANLRSVPFAALHDEQEFLIEKYSLALIPTFSLTATNSPVNIKTAQLLAMGVSESTQNQIPLPSVAVEVPAVTDDLWEGKGKGFLNEQFTLDNLRSLTTGQEFRIVHLATHADFKPGKIANSYIQMWNAKLQMDQLRKLSRDLHWDRVDLLVLSACRTALGDEQSELGFAGLAVNAGVKTAIGSLWYVDDQGSLALMTEFYSHLRNAPTKAEAFRQAQIAMLKGEVLREGSELQLSDQKRIALPPDIANSGDAKFSHPYFWSAFTVIGNWN